MRGRSAAQPEPAQPALELPIYLLYHQHSPLSSAVTGGHGENPAFRGVRRTATAGIGAEEILVGIVNG